MALTTKQFLDLTGLQSYDSQLKAWSNSVKQLGYKTILKSADGNKLYFFTKPSATLSDVTGTTPYVELGSVDVSEKLASLASVLGATLTPGTNTYTIDLSANFPSEVVDAVDAINNLKAAVDLLNDDDETAGSVAKAIKDAIEALDVTEFALTENNNDVISIYGIKEVDGKISKGASKIDLAKVAKTGAAADVSTAAITDGDATDPQTLYAAGTAQGTLEAIARDLNDLTTESAVTVEKLTTPTTGYLASYAVKQNGAQVGATIDIPKDFLVKSATVKTVTTADDPYPGAKVGDKYIDFVVNVKEGTATDTHLYIAVNDLVHPLSGDTTTVANEYELQISVDSTNKISATLNNIYAKKVQFVPTSATTVLTSVTTVEGALNKVDELIQGMDADLDAATDASITDEFKVAVLTGVTEVNGTLTAVDSIDVDQAGAATAAYNAIGSIASADINALFPV